MKTCLYIILIFISNLLFAQKNTEAVLFGKIENSKSNSLKLIFKNNPIDSTYTELDIILNENRQFYESYNFSRAIFAKIIIDSDTVDLFIEPSESIELNYNYKKHLAEFNSKFNNNKYLFTNYQNFKINLNEYISKISNNDFYTFSALMDTFKNKNLQILNSFNQSNILSPFFLKYMRSYIIYSIANSKYEYIKKNNLAEVIYENKPGNEVYMFYESLSTTQSDLLFQEEYQRFLINNIYYKYSQENKKGLTEQELMRLKFDLVLNNYEGREQYYALTIIFGDILNDYNYLYAKTLISEYMSTVNVKEYRSYIDRKIQLAIRKMN